MLPEQLDRQGYAVVKDFLPRSTCDALIAYIDTLDQSGSLTPAGIGKGTQHQIRPEIRSDLIKWLDDDQLSLPAQAAWDALEDLRINLNRSLYLGLRRFEGHLTRYPPGSHYAKHFDNFAGTSARLLSCIIYLNRDWRSEDGGHLRLFSRDNPERVECDITPDAGTLACFMSQEIAHEVLPTKRSRYSLTGWFRTD